MDDSASYPRACLDVFRAGWEESDLFLAADNRKAVLAAVGTHFFGSRITAPVRKEHTKKLFNAMDNDGSLDAWRRRMGVARDIPNEVRVPLPGGRAFSLRAHEQSRADITSEFSRRLPCMQQFVADWLRAHDPGRWHKRALTAKSYFLQEAEGISRRAKVAWAMRRGDVRVENLQHDGIVVTIPPGVSAPEVAAGLTAACGLALGYAQPVEEKPLSESSVGVGDGTDAAGAIRLAGGGGVEPPRPAQPASDEWDMGFDVFDPLIDRLLDCGVHTWDVAARTIEEYRGLLGSLSPEEEAVLRAVGVRDDAERRVFDRMMALCSEDAEVRDAEERRCAAARARAAQGTALLTAEALAELLDRRGTLTQINPHASPGWAELHSPAGAGKPAGVWYAISVAAGSAGAWRRRRHGSLTARMYMNSN